MMRSYNKLILIAFVLSCFFIIKPLMLFASVDLPWSTTYDCAEWNQYSDPIDCDGISKGGGWASPEGQYEQIAPAANNTNGDGGNGQRHWLCDGKNSGSGGTFVSFNQGQSEVWVRWYMRFQEGFQWGSYTGYKMLYMYSGGTHTPFYMPYGSNGIGLYAPYGDGRSHQNSNAGWQAIMGGATSNGAWHCFEYHIKSETAAENDGVLEIWVDGSRVVNETDVNFGLVSDSKYITGFIIGSNADSPSNGQCMYVDYDDILIRNTGYIGPIADKNTVPDTIPPSVSITSPTAMQEVSANITLSANAIDNVGVASVQFKVDGNNVGAEDTTSPYSYTLDTNSISDGSHIISATTIDTAGNVATSNTVSITINNGSISEFSEILFDDWETGNVNNWMDDFAQGATHIDSDPVYGGTYAIKMESSDPGSYAHFFGDHPGIDGNMITDVTVEEYIYLSPGFQWPSIGMKLWIMNCFESWSAPYPIAEGQSKPNTWAPYYMSISGYSNGQLYGNLTRADGLGGTGDLWHNYTQNIGTPISLDSGKWNKIKFRLKLNSIGQSDGVFQLWINDVLKCDYSDINYRGTYTDLGWNHLIMSMHANPSHPQNQWLSRDNIHVYSGIRLLPPENLGIIDNQ